MQPNTRMKYVVYTYIGDEEYEHILVESEKAVKEYIKDKREYLKKEENATSVSFNVYFISFYDWEGPKVDYLCKGYIQRLEPREFTVFGVKDSLEATDKATKILKNLYPNHTVVITEAIKK